MNKPILALLFAIPLCGFQASDKTYSLAFKPKLNQEMKYLVTAQVDADDLHLKIKVKQTLKVIKIEADGGYQLEDRESDGVAKVGEQEEAVPPDQFHVTVTKYDAKGFQIVEPKKKGDDSDNQFSFLSSLIMDPPEKPVAIGGTWTQTEPADEKAGEPGSKFTYVLKGFDKIGGVEVLDIHFTMKQLTGTDNVKSEGDYFVATDDFRLVRYEMSGENVKLGEDGPLATIKVKGVPRTD